MPNAKILLKQLPQGWLMAITIIVVNIVIRFSYLGIIPPGGHNALWLRLPSAIAGALSIIVFTLLILRISQNRLLALSSSLILALMPWHIEQSRISSPAMLGLLILLTGAFMWTVARCKKCKFILAIVISFAFYKAYPSFWIFSGNWKFPNAYEYLFNVYKLISVEFLFFKNDSFWLGGLRTMGALLPSTLPLLLIGLYHVVVTFNYKKVIWLLLGIVIWLIAAANPLFPEGQEFFLITPFLAVIGGWGIIKSFEWFKSKSLIKKVIFTFFVGVLIYDHLLFFHFYTVHYAQRIKNELTAQQRNF